MQRICRSRTNGAGIRTRLALGSALLAAACIVGSLGFASVAAAATFDQGIQGQSAAAPGAAGCNTTLKQSSPPPDSPPTATGGVDPVDPTVLMNDIVKQAATAAGRQALQIGFTLASQAILGNPTRDIIDKLNAINAKLDGISARIDGLTGLANQLLSEQRLQFFQAELRELCSYATDQKLVYSLYYMPMVRAAKALAD
ncbi:MAG: hypothetical protein M3322_01165, partial [Actinomycetota bacterium]|nr:hypothetical protein [Actinomycetota bacterium]